MLGVLRGHDGSYSCHKTRRRLNVGALGALNRIYECELSKLLDGPIIHPYDQELGTACDTNLPAYEVGR